MFSEELTTVRDHILVKQKDIILNRINNGAYSEAQAMLNVLRELWHACDYGYKWLECQQRLANAQNAEQWTTEDILNSAG